MTSSKEISEAANKTAAPLVSIIIITYNSAKYVEETVKSALNQTYGNIEIIVSDDCSKDNTLEVCNNLKRIAPLDCNLKLFPPRQTKAYAETTTTDFATPKESG